MNTKPPLLKLSIKISIAWLAVILFAGCGVVPKNYQPGKPFVFQTNINVQGDLSREERNRLESQLNNQLADSMQARTAQKLFKSILKNPPVFDTAAADQSIVYMQSLMRSNGYFYSQIQYDSSVKKVNDQLRTTVNFDVVAGKPVKLDSVGYNFTQNEIQNLTEKNKSNAVVKKGDAFAKGPMSAERDRLVEIYRNNGFLRFTSNEIIGLWDTLDLALLQPSFDPFEQIELLEKIKARQENPVASLEYRFKPGFDSTRLTKYYIGNITLYPDLSADSTTAKLKTVSLDSGRFKIIYNREIFKPKFLRRNYFLNHGDLFRQNTLVKTINRFNSLGAWRLISIEPVVRPGTDTVDFISRFSPAFKYASSVTLEGNRNQSEITGDLWGVGINLSLQNRNFGKVANSSVTNFRYGVEFGGKRGIQTQQTTLNQNIYFPRIIAINSNKIKQKYKERGRTVLSIGGSITDRLDYFNLKSFNISWGYETEWDNIAISLRSPNIEFSTLKPRDSLVTLIQNNPVIKNLFTDGLILSLIPLLKFDINWSRRNRIDFIRVNFQESGVIAGVIKNKFLDSNLYRFIKTDVEISRKVTLKKWNDGTDKTVVAMRFMGGIGYELGQTAHPDKRNNLPFFKSFYGGGPNSMRAWQLRRLGPGSLVKQFDGPTGTPERYGDIQIEANIEYRFHLFRFAGFKFNGALFTDAGNIWYLKKEAAPAEPEAVFNIGRLWKDIAVGVGGGLRIDFSFFLLRLDYSYKAKNPSPSPDNAASQNKWFYNIKPGNGTFQLGINYPFVL